MRVYLLLIMAKRPKPPKPIPKSIKIEAIPEELMLEMREGLAASYRSAARKVSGGWELVAWMDKDAGNFYSACTTDNVSNWDWHKEKLPDWVWAAENPIMSDGEFTEEEIEKAQRIVEGLDGRAVDE